MIKRKLSAQLKELASQVPVVTVTGPRQSGKTTLVKEIFPDYNYVNLEERDARALAADDYHGFFAKYKEPLIIDEIQRVPELLSEIQVLVDENRDKNGRFILTGSHQPLIREGISQSLAGRTSVLTLLPLSIAEIKESGENLPDTNDLILRGFMPELYKNTAIRSPYTYYRDYTETFVERDVRQIREIKDLDKFRRFLILLAGRIGQIVNLSSMSGELGVSSTTLSEWLSVLIACNIIYELKPFFSNISKRQTKNSKLYFVETGLAAHLLDLESAAQVDRDPLRGQLFENMVVMDALKARLNNNLRPNLFFTRTGKGVEVDLILKKEGLLFPFEIKSAMTPAQPFSKNLRAFCNAEENSKFPAVIYAGENYPQFNGVRYINYSDVADFMQ